jgi:DNA-binding NarL/FixJ family response regulator
MHNTHGGTRTLKPRDQKIIELVALGLKNSEIAQEIGTTEHVVRNYLKLIYDKLGMWNRLELALWHISRHENEIDAPQSTNRLAS